MGTAPRFKAHFHCRREAKAETSSPAQNATFSSRSFTFLIISPLLIKLAYEILYHRAYYYAIEDGHLVISAGVFLKQRGVFLLTSITDVYLSRGPLDFLFGLYDVHVSNPSSKSHQYGDILGLSTENAVHFQDYLKKLTEVLYPKAQKAAQIVPEELVDIDDNSDSRENESESEGYSMRSFPNM